MEADQGRRLAGIEMADDGVADPPVELLQRVGFGMDGGGGGTGPVGAILRFLNHEKDFLHGALQWHQSCSGGRNAASVRANGLGRHSHARCRVGCSRGTLMPEGIPGNGITRTGNGATSLIGGDELSDSERDELLQLCRQRLVTDSVLNGG